MQLNNKKKAHLIFFGLIFFALIFRLFGCFFLYDFENDEGGWLINAKNFVLFHQLSLEGVYYTALSPLNTFLHIPLFQIFGPSIMLGRFISIILSLGTVSIFFWFVKRNYGLFVSFLAGLIILVNGVYNKIATRAVLEPKLHLLEILTLVFCFSDKRWLRRLSFLPFGMALAFKPTVIYFILPLVYAISLRKDKEVFNAKILRQKFADMLFILGGALLVSGAFFYIAYLLDSANFISWGLEAHLNNRLGIRYLLMNSPEIGLVNKLIYFFLRSPLTAVLFIFGLIFTVTKKAKTRLDVLLLVWFFTEIVFFLLNFYVSVNYISDLIFPLAIFAAQFILRILGLFGTGGFKLGNYLVIALTIMLVFAEVGSSLYYFLIIKPGRPAIESVHWLKKQKFTYEMILSPPQISIDIPIKAMVTSNIIRLNELLGGRGVRYPLLCIMQKEAANYYPEDYVFLRNNARLIKSIGYFQFYEVKPFKESR